MEIEWILGWIVHLLFVIGYVWLWVENFLELNVCELLWVYIQISCHWWKKQWVISVVVLETFFAVYLILNKVGGPEKLLFIKVLSSIIFRKTSAQNI